MHRTHRRASMDTRLTSGFRKDSVMPLPATYLKCTLHFRCDDTGSRAQCVLWYLQGSGAIAPTLSTIAAYANSFMTAFTAGTSAMLAENSRFAKVTLKWVSGGNEVEGDSTLPSVPGTAAGDTLPEEVVVCIQRRTGQIGRNKRGRIFFPYIPEAYQQDGNLMGLGVSAATGLAAMVRNKVTHSGGQWEPQTPDWKTGVLVPVVQAGYVEQLCSRRDRRDPKVLTAVRV